MKTFQDARIKWPYVTHLIDRKLATDVLPPIDDMNPGAVVLARVVSLGKHRELEARDGRRMTLFAGDVIVGVLGNRYATDQFEAEARSAGSVGHIVGMGGVCGEVLSMNAKMVDPTVIEWLGRLAGPDGRPLHLSQFRLAAEPRTTPRPTTILSLGAAMNSGKTTTAAQMIRSLTSAGHRVAAAKITGTACRKDPNLLYDAGAVVVLDFTHAGWPSTAGCSREELLAIASHLRLAASAYEPEFMIIEIADGIVQRETRLLLEHEEFRRSIDAVTFAGLDALSIDAGVRRLRDLDYRVLATAGQVANGRLGIAEAESVSGIRCLSGESLLAGALVPDLRALQAGARLNGAASTPSRPPISVLRSTPGLAASTTPQPSMREPGEPRSMHAH